MRGPRTRLLGASFAAALLLAPPSGAAGEVSLHASFSPDRLRARTALTVSMRLGGEEELNLPPPVRTIALSLPAGLRVNVAGVGTCAISALRRRGPSGCARRSAVGHGHAVVAVHAGSQTIPEQALVWAFRAPDRGGRPAMWILSKGETPLQQATISSASLGAQSSRGLVLTVSVPPIRTLEFEPDASVVSMSLTVGGSSAGPAAAGILSMPLGCPSGGFPFAASFRFAGGLDESAAALVRCP